METTFNPRTTNGQTESIADAVDAYMMGFAECDGEPLPDDAETHIAGATGWSRATIRRYIAGWESNVRDPAMLARVLASVGGAK